MTIKVKNPATGELIEEINEDSEKDVKQAIQSCHDGFQSWSKINAHERSRLLIQWSNKIQDYKQEIATIMTKENGKPLHESLNEVNYATNYIDWFAEEAKRIYGRTIPANTETKRIIVNHEPIGLVAAITPWNFPAAMMTRKAAPALAAGCTFIIKPAVETPLTTFKIIELAHEAGIPEDAIKYVNGRGSIIGNLFTESKLIRKITFTGSTSIGKMLIKNSANTVKHVTMELGGHAPLIVAEDAEIDFAVQQTIISKFRNAGQTCVCANRILVHKNVVNTFSEKLKTKVNKLQVGNGLNEETDIGPIINKKGYDKIIEQINDAVNKGAEVISGNQCDKNQKNNAYFIHPTIIKNVDNNMDIMHNETFGPIAPIASFETLEEAVSLANDTPYGLAAYFFTNDYRVATYLHDNLHFGVIGWNDGGPSAAHAPFGGMKESGIGREGGIEGIESYLETKYLSIGGIE